MRPKLYPPGKCQCGCGQDTNLNAKTKHPYDYIRGHSTRAITLPDGKRLCKYCGEAKSLEEFVLRRRNRGPRHADDRDNRCKKCYAANQRRYYQANREQYARASKNRSLKRKYGITLAEFENLLTAQKGRCAICEKELEVSWDGKWKTGMERNSRVDHCHATGRVRGILCHHCNYGLGAFDDDPTRLRKAAEYAESE